MSTPNLIAPAQSLKIGIPSSGSIRFEDDKVQEQSFKDTVKRFKESEAQILEVDFRPFYEIANVLYFGPLVSERYITIEGLMEKIPRPFFLSPGK